MFNLGNTSNIKFLDYFQKVSYVNTLKIHNLKYFWERWDEQTYLPSRTHKIVDLIGPTPHKYLFVETEFCWCLKLCYYTIYYILGKFRVCTI